MFLLEDFKSFRFFFIHYPDIVTILCVWYLFILSQVEIARHEWVNNDGKQIAHDAVKKCNREWEVKVEQEVENRLQEINNGE